MPSDAVAFTVTVTALPVEVYLPTLMVFEAVVNVPLARSEVVYFVEAAPVTEIVTFVLSVVNVVESFAVFADSTCQLLL